MNAIAILDTSIVCEILKIPGKSEKDSHVIEELAEKVASEGLFLSMAAVLETGNHIGQLMDGGSRRNCAKKLVTLVQNALSGQSPFVPLGFGVGEWTFLKDGISEFPEWAAQNAGLGDLSIKKDWEKQCVLNPGRRVYIWSLDAHLSCFDRAPEIAAS